MAKNDGGPAYPAKMSGQSHHYQGMSLRDAFAKDVDISGYDFPNVATSAAYMGLEAPSDLNDGPALMRFSAKAQARLRYMLADAMLEERER